jgi:hypothetical protein
MMSLSTYWYRCIYRDGRRSTAALASVVLAPHDDAHLVNGQPSSSAGIPGIEE